MVGHCNDFGGCCGVDPAQSVTPNTENRRPALIQAGLFANSK